MTTSSIRRPLHFDAPPLLCACFACGDFHPTARMVGVPLWAYPPALVEGWARWGILAPRALYLCAACANLIAALQMQLWLQLSAEERGRWRRLLELAEAGDIDLFEVHRRMGVSVAFRRGEGVGVRLVLKRPVVV